MANIILPQVDLLTSTNDNTNILIEQGGQIKRVNKSLFEGSSDAETLNGHAASYFAPAASLSTTNTNVSNLSTRVSTIEGDYAKSSEIVDYSDDISELDTRVTTLESKGGAVTRTLLWSAPSSYENNGVGKTTLTLSSSLANFDYIEFAGCWTYVSSDYGWFYLPNVSFLIDQTDLTDTDIQYFWGNYLEGYRSFSLKTATSITLQKGYDSDGNEDNYSQVPTYIYGIKYN